jgi:hypothetical protein
LGASNLVMEIAPTLFVNILIEACKGHCLVDPSTLLCVREQSE